MLGSERPRREELERRVQERIVSWKTPTKHCGDPSKSSRQNLTFSERLRLLGHRGFMEEAAKHWEWVSPVNPTTGAEALRQHNRVVVPDVRKCAFIASSAELEVF